MRQRGLWIALGAITLTLSLKAAWSETVAANAPVSIETPVAPIAPETAASSSEPAPTEPVGPAAEPAATLPPRPTAAIERLPLGAARSSAPAISEAPEPTTSWWRRFDPRENDVVRTFGALGVVIGLIFAFKKIFRSAATGWLTRAGRPSGVMEVLARFPVGRRQTLLLMKMGRRLLLLHQTGTSMTMLSEVTDPNEVANLIARVEAGSRPAGGDQFEALLSRWTAKNDVDGATTEMVDLTRRAPAGVRRLLPRRAGS